MIKIGSHHGKEVKCLLTNMNEPLGCAVGNGVEVVEAIETLKGNGPKDFEELVITLASYMINLSLKIDLDKAKIMAKENLYNGKAYDKFKQMVALQGGNINNITVSDKKMEIVSDKSGYLNNIEALKLAKLVKDLGAGRNKKEDLIDYGVGIVLNKKEGQYVEKGEKLLDIYYNKDFNVDEFKSCFNIEETKKDVNPLIYKIM
jgi:pyrimidine-nucleoside phosphorylase